MKKRNRKYRSAKRRPAIVEAIVEFVNLRTVRLRRSNGNKGETFNLPVEACWGLLPGDEVAGTVGRFRGKRQLKSETLSVNPCKDVQVVLRISHRRVRGVKKQVFQPVGLNLPGQIESAADAVREHGDGTHLVATLSRDGTYWHQESSWTLVNIERVLHGSCEIAAAVALTRFGLRQAWPDSVAAELDSVSDQISRQVLKSRDDLRDLPFVTIDPESARDHDDAVYCEKSGAGGFRLSVAIADVAHYVKPRTALDSVALDRGASIYFPCYSVPMLPEELSSDICSLKPDEDRLALVCEMAISSAGEVESFEFREALIRSQARLSYEEAQRALSDNLFTGRVGKNLKCLFELHRAFLAARSKRCALDLELPQANYELSASGELDGVGKSVSLPSHSLIEEAMLAANTCAAKFIAKHYTPSAMYRIHDAPSESYIKEINQLLHEYNLDVQIDYPATVKDYQVLVEHLRDHQPAYYQVFQSHLLRSMTSAVYWPEMKPHFALNFPAYTHFTSPIRRYPDLVVHRLIKQVLNAKEQIPEQSRLKTIAGVGSYTERRADSCAREAEKWLKAEYMQAHIGDIFDAVVTDVRPFGVFVQIDSPFVDGMIPVFELGNEYFIYEDAARQLVGSYSGNVYRIADRLRVQIVEATPELGHINLQLA